MPLLRGCVRESADGSGATSGVYKDTFPTLFLYFLSLAWRVGTELTESNAE